MTSTGVDRCSEIMQQADVSALRLLEALVVTLPQTVLQTYVLICTDVGLSSPGTTCLCVCLCLYVCWIQSPYRVFILSLPPPPSPFPLSFPNLLLSLSSVSVCFAVCLLSLAWALVLYARACSLIRPGHLPMSPAAITCRLLWRVGGLPCLGWVGWAGCVG